MIEGYQPGYSYTYEEVLEMAIEALKRTGMYMESGHPEDLVASLVSSLESVAVGYSHGYRDARAASRQSTPTQAEF